MLNVVTTNSPMADVPTAASACGCEVRMKPTLPLEAGQLCPRGGSAGPCHAQSLPDLPASRGFLCAGTSLPCATACTPAGNSCRQASSPAGSGAPAPPASGFRRTPRSSHRSDPQAMRPWPLMVSALLSSRWAQLLRLGLARSG